MKNTLVIFFRTFIIVEIGEMVLCVFFDFQQWNTAEIGQGVD